MLWRLQLSNRQHSCCAAEKHTSASPAHCMQRRTAGWSEQDDPANTRRKAQTAPNRKAQTPFSNDLLVSKSLTAVSMAASIFLRAAAAGCSAASRMCRSTPGSLVSSCTAVMPFLVPATCNSRSTYSDLSEAVQRNAWQGKQHDTAKTRQALRDPHATEHDATSCRSGG